MMAQLVMPNLVNYFGPQNGHALVRFRLGMLS